MTSKTFEVSKGRGKNKVVQEFKVKSQEDLKILGTFIYHGWAVKEKKG